MTRTISFSGADLRDVTRDAATRLLMRIGADLQLVVRYERADKKYISPTELHVQAVDGDGNYLTTLAVIDGLELTPEVITVCRHTARALFTDYA